MLMCVTDNEIILISSRQIRSDQSMEIQKVKP